MELIKLENIIDFLAHRGWTESPQQNSNRFKAYMPPIDLGLPQDFMLELPKKDSSKRFQQYAIDLIDTITEIYTNVSNNDLKIVLTNKNGVFSTRIEDEDTKNGTIGLERFSKKIEALIKIIKQSVTFTTTNKPIFGDAKEDVKHFIDHCKGLQTEAGSFITKIQLPNTIQSDLFEVHEQNDKIVMGKLFDILDFIQKDVIFMPIKDITSAYITQHSQYINVELFTAIKELHQKVKMNNGAFSYLSQYIEKSVTVQHFLKKKLLHFSLYIKAIKNVLLAEIPLVGEGHILGSTSKNVLNSEVNFINVEAEIANNIEKIKLQLNNKQYQEAIEAHKQNRTIAFKGLAKVNKNQYFIKEVDSFQILDNNQNHIPKSILTIPNA